ncbi:MAG: FHA domain-containing protein [Anaerolineae bacterium]|nr:FHA domain-containing protein [Anaerolineae bacterium]
MQHSRGFIALLVLVFFFTFAGLTSAQGNGPVTEIIVTAVDAAEFPEVTVYARALNAEGAPVSGLTTSNLQLLENGDRVELERGPVIEEGPVWVHFVIDAGLRMGQADRWNQTREAIRQFVQTHMLPDDRVRVSAIEGSNLVPLLPDFTKNPNDVTAVLDDFRPPTCANADECLSAPIQPLGQILNELDRAEGASDQPRLVILFTSELERYESGEPAALANEAAELGIPIYAVLVAGRDANGLVTNMATTSGGQSLNLTDTASADNFYRQIAETLRPVYEMAYRSPDGLASTRVVEVVADDGRVTGQGEYTVDQIELPRVTIESPTENARLTPDAPLEVVAKVVFTDNHPRNLQRATLTVNGVPTEPLTNIRGPDEITFTVPWALVADLAAESESGAIELAVIVKDEFNLDSRPASANVTVVLPTTAAPTEEPDTVIIDGTAVPVTAVPQTTVPPTANGGLSNTLLAIGMVLLAVAMIVVVMTRNKGPVLAVRQTVNKQIDRITKRIEKQSNPRAYLTVLEGDVSVGKKLEIYGTTTIGRAKQDAELLFQQHDDTSPISRRHCTIIDEEDHFMIRDEDSANGTFLNGVRLESMQPRELQDGDEIELARVERGGVKLQFESATPSYGGYGRDPNTSDTFDSGRSTRVVRRPNQSGGDRF